MPYWFYAYDNYNYAGHFYYYWPSQQALAHDNPSISKTVDFQSDVLQERSTKFFQIRMSSNLLTKIKNSRQFR